MKREHVKQRNIYVSSIITSSIDILFSTMNNKFSFFLLFQFYLGHHNYHRHYKTSNRQTVGELGSVNPSFLNTFTYFSAPWAPVTSVHGPPFFASVKKLDKFGVFHLHSFDYIPSFWRLFSYGLYVMPLRDRIGNRVRGIFVKNGVLWVISLFILRILIGHYFPLSGLMLKIISVSSIVRDLVIPILSVNIRLLPFAFGVG